MEEQIAGWLEEALAEVPEAITATARIVTGDSEAAALCETAETLGADLLVVGARKGGLFGRFQMGSAVNALLHSAPVPVALAPRGYSYQGPITRVTTFLALAVAPPTSLRSALIVHVAVRFPCASSRSS